MLSYTPHNGLADQLRQLSLAHALAERLQRTLVIPALLSHFDASTRLSELEITRNAHRLNRPPLSWLLDLSHSGLPMVDARTIPPAFALPGCSVGTSGAGGATGLHCVHIVEPPPMNGSVSAAIREWASLRSNKIGEPRITPSSNRAAVKRSSFLCSAFQSRLGMK